MRRAPAPSLPGQGQSYPVLRLRLPALAPCEVLQVLASGATNGRSFGARAVTWSHAGPSTPSIVWPACHVGRRPLLCGSCWSSVRPQRQQTVRGLALAAALTSLPARTNRGSRWCGCPAISPDAQVRPVGMGRTPCVSIAALSSARQRLPPSRWGIRPDRFGNFGGLLDVGENLLGSVECPWTIDSQVP